MGLVSSTVFSNNDGTTSKKQGKGHQFIRKKRSGKSKKKIVMTSSVSRLLTSDFRLFPPLAGQNPFH